MHSASGRSGFELRDDFAVKGIIGLGLPEAIRTLYPEIGDAEMTLFRQYYADHYIASEAVPSPLFEGVVESMAAFREQGYHLAVATGKTRRGLDRVLKANGWEDYFDITRARRRDREQAASADAGADSRALRCSARAGVDGGGFVLRSADGAQCGHGVGGGQLWRAVH